MTSYPLPENLQHQAIDSPEFICIPDMPVATDLPEQTHVIIDYKRASELTKELIAHELQWLKSVLGLGFSSSVILEDLHKIQGRGRVTRKKYRRIKSHIDHYGEFISVPETQLAVTVPAPETRKINQIIVYGSRFNYGRTAYMERLIAEKQREGKRVLIFDVER